jgi:hypothetical protein
VERDPQQVQQQHPSKKSSHVSFRKSRIKRGMYMEVMKILGYFEDRDIIRLGKDDTVS